MHKKQCKATVGSIPYISKVTSSLVCPCPSYRLHVSVNDAAVVQVPDTLGNLTRTANERTEGDAVAPLVRGFEHRLVDHLQRG